ncbi:hypothetical protein VNO78_27766 [Psophocarpus tetragonolobus]|uniref:Uncharacterized protein n=1 Tax=Psophocarpus tetragonolobus TaxID=3891 RepID=A0AAN9S3T6_PSOTE
MEPKVDKKPPKIQVKIPKVDTESFKKNSHMLVSPTSQDITRKNSSGKLNCLCSPTTHVGSFRCRHHRTSRSEMRRGKSVGSNISELGSKASSISNPLHAQ